MNFIQFSMTPDQLPQCHSFSPLWVLTASDSGDNSPPNPILSLQYGYIGCKNQTGQCGSSPKNLPGRIGSTTYHENSLFLSGSAIDPLPLSISLTSPSPAREDGKADFLCNSICPARIKTINPEERSPALPGFGSIWVD